MILFPVSENIYVRRITEWSKIKLIVHNIYTPESIIGNWKAGDSLKWEMEREMKWDKKKVFPIKEKKTR